MNFDKVLMVLGMAELYPDSHDQGEWVNVPFEDGVVATSTMANNPSSCGTTLCLAGWAAAMFSPPESVFTWEDGEFFYIPNKHGDFVLVTEDGETTIEEFDAFNYCCDSCTPRFDRVSIMNFAEEQLGLSVPQASALFNGSNTIERLKKIIRYLLSNPDADAIDMLYV